MRAPEDAYGNQKRLEYARALLAAQRPARVLDFGCGTGLQLTLPLARACPDTQFLGVDSDARSIAFARTNCIAANLRFAPVAALGSSERFDVIIVSEVIEHVDAPARLLQQLGARLEDGGRLLLTVPNGYGAFEIASLARDLLEMAGVLPFLRRARRRRPGSSRVAATDTHAVSPHINFFSIAEVQAAVASAGLRVVDFRARTLLCGFGFDLLVRGERLAGWNAALADRLPAPMASDWMLLLERAAPAHAQWEYRPGRYALFRRRLTRALASCETPRERRAWAAHKLKRALRRAWWRLRDRWLPSYSSAARGEIARLLRPLSPDALDRSREALAGASGQYLAHRFDLLGSGWTAVAHGITCRGLHAIAFPPGPAVRPDVGGEWLNGRINRANLRHSRRIWRMVSPGYRPIDWQLDFKSGYRWSEATPSHFIRPPQTPGADIKVPWELARMQHLPQLAHAYALAVVRTPGFEPKERYATEFRDQVLDFIATNPPRFGVNWASSMDVAIRLSNFLVARDLFLASGATFDRAFDQVFARSMLDHAAHVARTLDWHPRYRGNHYLCGIAGLMFAAAYLPQASIARRWRRRAALELEAEAMRQFLPDGGSFEASTGYHRLSGEALIYASALASDQLPASHFERLARIAAFSAQTARPDGRAPQIGDQDSGRFLKLSACWERSLVRDVKRRYGNLEGYRDLEEDTTYWDEDLRNHGHLPAAACGLIGGECFADQSAAWPAEPEAVSGLRGDRPLRVGAHLEPMRRLGDREEHLRLLDRMALLTSPKVRRYRFDFPQARRTAAAFPHFGLYIIRSDASYLCIRCGPVGLNGLGAHAHNDALSIELVHDGRDLVLDPGSYLYTPLPAERNRYRSVKAHFAPCVADLEPVALDDEIFRLRGDPNARCLFFDADGFLGSHEGYGAAVYRHVRFEDRAMIIEDFSEDLPLQALRIRKADSPAMVPFSVKYGARLHD